MNDGSQIKAGGVHFEIGASTKPLKKSLSESQREVATSTKQMGAEAVKAAKAQEAELIQVVKRIRQQLGVSSLTASERGGLSSQLDGALLSLRDVRSRIPGAASAPAAGPTEVGGDSALSRLGGKASSALTNAITKGLVGIAAIQAFDAGLRELGDRLRESTAAGGSLDGREIGIIFGQAFAKGLESIPIAGSLGKILAETVGQRFFGDSLDVERAFGDNRDRADQLRAAYGSIGGLIEGLDRDGLSEIARFLDDAEGKLKPIVARLEELGQSTEAINEAAAEYRLRIEAAARARVTGGLNEALSTIDRMTGVVDEQAERWRQIEKLAQRVAQSFIDIGRADLAQGAADTVRERFRWAEAEANRRERQAELERKAADAVREASRDAERKAKSIEDIVSNLERQAGDIGKTGLEQLRDQLFGLGAGSDFVERALRARAAIDQAAVGPISSKTYGTFSTFLASRLDQQVANEPLRKMEDKVGKIQRDLERLLREIRDPDRGLAFGA